MAYLLINAIQAFINEVFHGMFNYIVVIYIDNIFIYSKTYCPWKADPCSNMVIH